MKPRPSFAALLLAASASAHAGLARDGGPLLEAIVASDATCVEAAAIVEGFLDEAAPALGADYGAVFGGAIARSCPR